MIISTYSGVLVLQGKLSDEQAVRVLSGIGRILQLSASGVVEVDSQEGPLTFISGRHTLDSGDMEWHESASVVVRNKDSVVLLIHIEDAWLNITGDLLGIVVGLDITHLLDLVLFGGTLNLVARETFLELL